MEFPTAHEVQENIRRTSLPYTECEWWPCGQAWPTTDKPDDEKYCSTLCTLADEEYQKIKKARKQARTQERARLKAEGDPSVEAIIEAVIDREDDVYPPENLVTEGHADEWRSYLRHVLPPALDGLRLLKD